MKDHSTTNELFQDNGYAIDSGDGFRGYVRSALSRIVLPNADSWEEQENRAVLLASAR